MKKNELLQEALEYFQENEDIFNQCLEEMDGYGHIITAPYLDYSDRLNIYTVEDIVGFIAEHGTIDALFGEMEIEKILEELLKEE